MANCPSCHREIEAHPPRTVPLVTLALVVSAMLAIHFSGMEDSARRYVLFNNLPIAAVGLGLAFERWLGR